MTSTSDQPPFPGSSYPAADTTSATANEDAEKAVIGILLSGGDFDEVRRRLTAEDFYYPANRAIYETMTRLRENSITVEPIAVVTEMRTKNTLSLLPSGANYVTDLYGTSPSASSLTYYMKIVKDASTMRNINALGQLAQHMSKNGAGTSPSEILAQISSQMSDLANEQVSTEVAGITEVLTGTLNEIVALQKGEGVSGIPTGFTDLDSQLNGLHPGQMIIIAARPGVGKALACATPIPVMVEGKKTWKTMERVCPGDYVYTPSGGTTRVSAVSNIFEDRPCYNLSFSTGETLCADEEHLWKIHVREGTLDQVDTERCEPDLWGPGQVVNTAELSHIAGRNRSVTVGILQPARGRTVLLESIVPMEHPSATKCLQVEAADGLFLAGWTEITTHNSSLALDIARNTAVRLNKSVLLFNLEMSANELGMRALSAEAYVNLRDMRTENGIDSHRWTQVQAAADRLNGKNLGIDDNPNVTMEDIRAKAKLWRDQHGLDLIVIDYIQLMNSARRFDSRQQEVSEISRSIKLLAKELEIPIIALSQLNRGSEQRSDKKPALSDLRESGCVTGDTTIVRADTGQPVSFNYLIENGWVENGKNIKVWSITPEGYLSAQNIINVFPSGRQEVFRLTLASGKTVKATATHKFRTLDGWTPLGDMAVGEYVAIPRIIPEPAQAGLGWSEEHICQTVQQLVDDVEPGRRLPDVLYSASNKEISLFLNHLWHTGDGSIKFPEAEAGKPEIFYTAPNRMFADDVSHLLLRLGIVAHVRKTDRMFDSDHLYRVVIPDMCGMTRFVDNVGAGEELWCSVKKFTVSGIVSDMDVLPPGVWGKVEDEIVRTGKDMSVLAGRPENIPFPKVDAHHGASRRDMGRIADVLGSETLTDLANNDIFWDRIVSVEFLGVEPVYDATVENTHNFIAHDIVLKNSLEQDADVVLLVHREEIYDRESPRAGEADVSVAKNRSGPTGTIVLSWLGKFSRFDNRTI